MYRKLFFCCIFSQFNIVRCMNFIFDEQLRDGNEDMVTCLVNILSSRTQFGLDLAIINNEEVTNDLIRRIHATNNVKLYVKDFNKFVDTSPGIFIIHVQDLSGFQVVIDQLDKDWNRKPESLHIIVLTEISEEDRLPIFQTLWKYHIIRVLVITDDLDDKATIYTYFPYAEGRCGRDYKNTMKLCTCESAKVIDVIELVRDIDKPVLTNCTLQVATHNFPPLVLSDRNPENPFAVGMEKFLFDILVEKEHIILNYTYFPEADEFGNISDNFTVTGKLSKLYCNEVDLVFGGFALNNRRVAFFDYICAHLSVEDSFVAVSPRAGLVERWKIVYIMFNSILWLTLGLVIVICAILLLDYNISSGKRIQNDSCLVFLNVFGSATHNRALVLTRNIYKNLLIIHWLWFMFLLNSYYQTRLTSFSTYRPYKPEVKEYRNLINYNFTPCFASDVAPFLKNSGDVVVINEEYLEVDGCETGDLALDQVANTQTKYTITNYLRYLWWTTQHKQDKKKIYLVKDTFYNLPYGLYFKRGFPLLHDYQIKLCRFIEFGFLEATKSFHWIPKQIRTVPDDVGSFETRVLKLEDVTIPFGILILGHIFASVVFMIEISHSNKTLKSLVGPSEVNTQFTS